jgi:hypothetical protein
VAQHLASNGGHMLRGPFFNLPANPVVQGISNVQAPLVPMNTYGVVEACSRSSTQHSDDEKVVLAKAQPAHSGCC